MKGKMQVCDYENFVMTYTMFAKHFPVTLVSKAEYEDA